MRYNYSLGLLRYFHTGTIPIFLLPALLLGSIFKSNISGAVHYLNNFGAPPPRVVMDSPHTMNSAEDTEYLHLVDCETAQGSTLQLIDKVT